MTDEVRAQVSDGTITVPGGGYLRIRPLAVLFRAMTKTKRVTLGSEPKKGPFSVWVICPGVEGSEEEEDKPHDELCQGEVQ